MSSVGEILVSASATRSAQSVLLLLLSLALQCAQVTDWKSAKSIYEFSAKDIDGNEVSLEKYRYTMSHGIYLNHSHTCIS